MEQFRRNELDILIATSIIEVGIDVPNATVILIEGAERFGLAVNPFTGPHILMSLSRVIAQRAPWSGNP